MVVEVESEGAGCPAVVCSGASLGVGNVAPGVLPLQVDVHHEVLGLDLAAQCLALLGALVIHLDVFHGEIRQVFQHHLVLSLEEVLAVEQQVVNLLAVDVYVAVVLELHPRHLADESVEHRTLGEVERRGVVDDGVAAVCYLHARAADHHFVEPHISIYVVLGALYVYGGHQVFGLAAAGLHVVGHESRLVALGLYLQHVAGRASRHRETEARECPPQVARVCVDGGRVGVQQRHHGLYACAGERVVNFAAEKHRALLLCGPPGAIRHGWHCCGKQHCQYDC